MHRSLELTPVIIRIGIARTCIRQGAKARFFNVGVGDIGGQYVPVLNRKPGAVRNGAPFKGRVLPGALGRVQRMLARLDDGDRHHGSKSHAD